MQFGRAFSYIFEDREWLPKVAIIFLLSALSTVPFFGLIAVAALLGYMTELIYYVRTGHPQPLPGWRSISKTLNRGGSALGAFLIWNLPNVLVLCCFFTLWGVAGGLGSIGAIVVLCCAAPFLLIWNLLVYPFLGVGLIRYGEHENISVFFQLGALFNMLRQDIPLTLEWIVWMVIVNFLAVIPLVGWAFALAFWVPVQGHLIGQYAARLDHPPKTKSKRAEQVV